MLKSDVIEFYGGKKACVARALGISRQAINGWKEVVPRQSALELQLLTGGQLKIDQALYQKKVCLKKQKQK